MTHANHVLSIHGRRKERLIAMKKRLVVLGSVVLLVALLALGMAAPPVIGCETPTPTPTPPPLCRTQLIVGQEDSNGYVEVWDDGECLYVEYEAPSGCEIVDTHVYADSEPPTKSAPGRFPYSEGDCIPPSGDPYVYIAAHAVVVNCPGEETGWADSYSIPFGRGWAMYFGYDPATGQCFEPGTR
jgi:hypothetical protein